MSKASPPLLLCLSVLLPGCGEPVFATIAAVDGDRADVQVPTHGALDAGSSRARDASSSTAMTTTSNAATTGLPSNCIALPERALPDVSSDGGGLVIARPATDVGCASSDAGASYFTSVFRRRDGEPLTQQGELYSLRWTLGTLSQRVRAIVGETRDSCPDVVVLDGPTTLLSTCQEFTSPIESAQLLLYEDDFLAPLSLLNPMASQQLALCRGSCPPGTQPVVADAGVASDAGDAGGYGGYVTPAIPSVPSFP